MQIQLENKVTDSNNEIISGIHHRSSEHYLNVCFELCRQKTKLLP
jgi:hypothetical protein